MGTSGAMVFEPAPALRFVAIRHGTQPIAVAVAAQHHGETSKAANGARPRRSREHRLDVGGRVADDLQDRRTSPSAARAPPWSAGTGARSGWRSRPGRRTSAAARSRPARIRAPGVAQHRDQPTATTLAQQRRVQHRAEAIACLQLAYVGIFGVDERHDIGDVQASPLQERAAADGRGPDRQRFPIEIGVSRGRSSSWREDDRLREPDAAAFGMAEQAPADSATAFEHRLHVGRRAADDLAGSRPSRSAARAFRGSRRTAGRSAARSSPGATGRPGTRARAPRRGCRRCATPPSRPAPSSPASSGTTIRRSSRRSSVPGICTARGSAAVSLMNSGRPLCSRLPMMPRPGSMTADLSSIGQSRPARRSRGRSCRRSSGRKMALFSAASSSLAWPAMRSITVARSSVDDRSRPTSDSADDSRAWRCVSSSRRAFSSATPIERGDRSTAGALGRRRTRSRARSSRCEIAAIRRSPTITGTKTHDRLASVPGTTLTPIAPWRHGLPSTTGRPVSSAWLIVAFGLERPRCAAARRTPCS